MQEENVLKMNHTHITDEWLALSEVGIKALIASGATKENAYNTAAQWRHRGFIPPSMHQPVVAMAERLKDFKWVTHEYLHKQWKRAKK